MKTTSLFDKKVSFAGITLAVDPINRKRNDKSDNVMAIFYEEQPFMWEWVKEEIRKTISSISGEVDFLDVGTGSGAWSILVKKNIENANNIVAIDKSPRAVIHAKANAKLNGVDFKIQQELYNMNSAPYRSCKAIGIYAPYHLYPKEVELQIPQHARGGVDGQQVFKEQLCVANYHLAEGGSIVFNQMCLGRDGKPEFTKYILELIENSSLEYINIFPPMDTKEFLEKIYDGKFPEYVEKIVTEFPELYYCDGIIRRDGKGDVREVEHSVDLQGRTWQDRIALHLEIAKHAL